MNEVTKEMLKSTPWHIMIYGMAISLLLFLGSCFLLKILGAWFIPIAIVGIIISLRLMYQWLLRLKSYKYNLARMNILWSEEKPSPKLLSSMLIHALVINDEKLIEELMNYELDVNFIDKKGRVPLFVARTVQATELLIKKGADINFQGKKNKFSALLLAVSFNLEDKALYLIDQGADINLVSHRGWTALMHAARLGSIKLVKVLIDQGCELNITAKCGRTALSIAHQYKRDDVVRYLHFNGAI